MRTETTKLTGEPADVIMTNLAIGVFHPKVGIFILGDADAIFLLVEKVWFSRKPAKTMLFRIVVGSVFPVKIILIWTMSYQPDVKACVLKC